MNIRDLQYIVAVADLKSFSRAAEKCYTTQPTLSSQIKKFEEQLNVKIFERTNKKVMITDIGHSIIASAKEILAEVANIKEIAEYSKDELAGKFRLGAFPTLSTYIFPTLVPKIRKHLPRIKLILIEEKTAQLTQMLLDGELDAALLALPISNNSLEEVKLFDDEFMLATATDHPLAKSKKISYAQLAAYKLLLLEEGHCLRDQSLEVCHISGLNEDEDMRATSLETLRQMVKAGSGITFIPEIAINLADKDIHYIKLPSPTPMRQIGLVWRKTSNRLKIIDIICELARQPNP